MNKIFLTSILSVAALAASAQGAYDAGNIIQSDLNGSARYVGMGGALNALGADISLMTTNPAGTGLYRRSDVGLTLGGVVSGEKAQMDNSRSKMSLDQAGVVFAFQVDNSGTGLQFVNFGVNYKKNKNFFGNNIVDVQHLNNSFSQTFQIADLANANYDNVGTSKQWGLLADISAPLSGSNGHDGIIAEDEKGYYGLAAKEAGYRRATYGSDIEADINVSFNVSDRFYYGASVGIYNVDYNRDSFYEELGVDNYYYDFTNWYRTTGTGVDLKFGFIVRPIESSPFRIGLSVHTPTWYSLTDANGSSLYMGNVDQHTDYFVADGSSGDYDYKLRTPWKFNLSFGHTIGSKFAIGAEYEFADYASARYGAAESLDREYIKDINNHMSKRVLKGQHAIKIGAEFKPISCLSVRAGYNLITSAYKSTGYNTILYFEPFTDTDFTNWGPINRVTLGCGYNWKSGYVDIAYQYQGQKGDFYAFDEVNLKPTTIKNNRSHIMGTIGFRF